jgi:hypothetical protein
MTMNVRGTTDVVSWVLDFGDKAVVIEPPSLRNEVAAEIERAHRTYAGREAELDSSVERAMPSVSAWGRPPVFHQVRISSSIIGQGRSVARA